MKLNCWEFKKRRQPGGPKVAELRTCPAPTEQRPEGCNSGKNAGRTCWFVAGTLCAGKVQGTFAAKMATCLQCDFYRLVFKEEGNNAIRSRDALGRVR